MMSVADMMTFPNSERLFLENNLLDATDWEKSAPYEYDELEASPTTSNDSSQFDNSDYTTTSLQADDLDSWFESDLNNFITQDDIMLKNTIKQEPLSPQSITQQQIFPTILVPHNETKTINIPQPVNASKLSNLNIVSSKTAIQAVPVVSSNNPPINTIHIKNIVPVSVGMNNKILINAKTNQPTSLVTQETKVLSSPHVVKLENGQYYVSNVMQKPTVNVTANLVSTGVKRPSNVKTETLLPQNLAELKTYKRKQRMMKNRESACLSRQRKKQHVSLLETKVNQMAALNKQLWEENEKLKERIQNLETENSTLKILPEKPFFKEHTKKSTFIFTIVLLFIFNPFTSNNEKTQIPPQSAQSASMLLHHRSRSLLQYDNSNVNNFDIPYSKNNYNTEKYYFNDVFNKKQKLKINKIRQRNKLKDIYLPKDLSKHVGFSETDVDCGEQFNKTELNRINQALQGLVKGLNKEKQSKTKSSRHDDVQRNTFPSNSTNEKLKKTPSNCNDSHPPTPRPLLPTRTMRPHKYKKTFQPNRFPVIKNTSQELVKAIQKSISRKADTFYVVSLLKDYIILPATNYNQTQRPKVSFMLPAFHPHSNDSMKDGDQLPMLLIDCTVIDTKLVHINRHALSKYSFTQLK